MSETPKLVYEPQILSNGAIQCSNTYLANLELNATQRAVLDMNVIARRHYTTLYRDVIAVRKVLKMSQAMGA